MSGSRERVLDAAGDLIAAQGWPAMTMAAVARGAGLSRQSVYALVGDRDGLAAAIVAREVGRFLELVDTGLGSGADPVEGVRRTVRLVLEAAAANPVLAATLAATHGKDVGEVLPLLTTRSEPLLAAAGEVVGGHLGRLAPDLDAADAAVLVDTVVRVVLSHVMRPGAPPAEVADGVAWLVGRVVGRAGQGAC